MKNKELPFFDTSISNKVDFINSVSLLNIQSINDFQKKIDKKLKHQDLEEIFVLMELNLGKNENGLEKLLKLIMFLLKLKKIYQDVLQLI